MPALCIGLIAYLLVSSPNLGLERAETVLILGAGLVPVLSVWAGAEVFIDRPAFRPWHGVVAALVVVSTWLAPFLPVAATVRGALVILLYAGLLGIAVSTAPGDLVETRRRFRRWFVALMALMGLGISGIELLRLDSNLPPWMYPLHAAGFLVLTLLFLLWAVRVAPGVWPPQQAVKAKTAMPLSGADAAVLHRVETAMGDGIWRTEGLTIAQLAAATAAPEHRVRTAINKGLGYRNFAQYINKFRIEAACEVLSDPTCADTPVLTIAYDVGFASIGPFNRAFRQIHDQSPTAYRNACVSPAASRPVA
ncbi:DNA-binding transcriptional activator FeaR [Ruegeria meonggei]|uniref:DNA-binding transcriptional activator FeaR n=1 Tax=Ruegeria meonggei TaxID=1446476 RepID=A0A1X6YWD9_9RHOB|nr:DNA-binding transcriptional activator FeaR [Ruegeria meonggei]